MDDRPSDDPITDAILSTSQYERLRYAEGIITVPVSRVLTYQAVLLALLASILPLYSLYPPTIGAHVGTLDPFLAAPKILFLGLVGWVIEVASALALAALYWYRVGHEPLEEGTARAIVNLEQIAIGLSLVTGGLAIVATVGLIGLGVFGVSVFSTYLSAVAGENVFAQGGGISVGHLSILAISGGLVVLGVRAVLDRDTG
ncbi:putative membrane protein [Halapricum desulfuricans]|uniref:Putative membrane protein n=1 Tax=Halapricum desulfuricans TaxID=2841257 RepID=A0A897N8B3_9EURY|nr:hypothetical protein [Halapricum desulfuricans]QSG10640.1 putative membrane protein [Halapricum desulfuricans]